jgi:hypothetical protein
MVVLITLLLLKKERLQEYCDFLQFESRLGNESE